MPRNGSKQKNNADTGEVAEWFNAAVLKTVEDASPPRVRISASPPIVVQKALLMQGFFVVGTELNQRKFNNQSIHFFVIGYIVPLSYSVVFRLYNRNLINGA